MPTYQYRCTECGHDLEAVQKFSDATLTECPNCGGRLRKVFNAVGVVFKGSGFYRNDSREKSASSSGSATDTKTDTKTERKSETKSETTTAAKTDSSSGTKTDKAPASA